MPDGTEKLIDALAERLPSNANEKAVQIAVLKAVEALPESKAKLRARILRDEKGIVQRLVTQLKSVSGVDEKEGEDDSFPAETGADELVASNAAACYESIDTDDPHACLARCSQILYKAIGTLNPLHHAELATSGFVALFPAEASPYNDEDGNRFDHDALRQCVDLIPAAMLSYTDDRRTNWRQFLGFLLTAPARLPECNSDDEVEIAVLAVRLGSLVALASRRPATARSVLRAGLVTFLGQTALTDVVLARLAPALPAVVRAAFVGGVASEKDDPTRGDLVGLLHALRFVGLCRAGRIGNQDELSETRTALCAALEHDFDATLLQGQLKLLAARVPGKQGTKLQQKISSSAGKGRAGAAGLITECMEAVPPGKLSRSALQRLADCSGLPVGEDERVDQKAAAARAKGDLFFEDTCGVEDDDDDEFAGTDLAIAGAASLAARQPSLGRLEGVEALKSAITRDFKMSALKTLKKPKRKRQRSRGVVAKVDKSDDDGIAGGAEEAEASAAAPADVEPQPKKQKLKAKKKQTSVE